MMKTMTSIAVGATLVCACSLHAALFTSDFSGSKPWNFDAIADPSNQLWGTGELIYSGAVHNVSAYVTKDINGATVFPDETGALILKLKLDLSEFPTASSDFTGPALVEIATSGNKSSFSTSLGKLYTFSMSGFNTPGQYRFGHSVAWIFWSSGGGNASTGAITTDNRPAFPLVYDMLAIITVSGNDTDGWLVHAKTDITGPVDAVGTIGLQTMTSAYLYVNSSINGLKSITGLRVGGSRGTLATGPSDRLVLDDVELSLVPEPASALLLAVMAAAAWRRRA